MAPSSIQKKGKSTTELMSKYGTTSAVATTVDFTIFHFVLTSLGTTAVQSTVIGRCFGAIVAFLFHRNWVFKGNVSQGLNVIVTRYLSGVLLGMGLNVGGVWILNSFFELNPWTSRMITAASVWFLVFLYNKHVVFFNSNLTGNERIIAEQDFAEMDEDIEDENTVRKDSYGEGYQKSNFL